MSRARIPALRHLAQTLPLGVGVALAALYLIQFDDPPYPALVPVAFWFFYLMYLSLLWSLRLLGGGPSIWRQSMALIASATLTVALYLAGHVGEQQRDIHLRDRSLSD